MSLKNQTIDFSIIGRLASLFNALEDFHDWDLSVQELAQCIEFGYECIISKGFPVSHKDIGGFYTYTCDNVWGGDESCEACSELIVAFETAFLDAELEDYYKTYPRR